MAENTQTAAIVATCHCGKVSITLAAPPTTITHCNCNLCRRYGVLWAYYGKAEVIVSPLADTHTYAWNGRNVDFHRCADCGCVTHWWPRNTSRDRVGINARLLDPPLAMAAAMIQKDAAENGFFY